MNFTITSALSKTEKGTEEIAKRTFGLNLKMRQLLILIDGKRTTGDLIKMMPTQDVQAGVEMLIQEGFVSAETSKVTNEPHLSVSEQTHANSAANSTNEQPSNISAPAVGIAVNAKSDKEIVMRAARLLTETLGPNADDFALRIERCKSLEELRELVPQMYSIVEGVLGGRALGEFTRRLGVF